MADSILIMVQKVEEFWNEKKGLDYNAGHPKHILKRLAKLMKEIRALNVEGELETLCELYQVDKKYWNEFNSIRN